MNKRNQLKHLSDEEKILWYELHSNPTGSDSSDFFTGIFIWAAIIAAIVFAVFYFK